VTAELGIGFVPYSPLGRGFLAGNAIPRSQMTPNDWRLHDPRYEPGNYEANLAILDTIRTVADAKGVSLAQVALAWLLAKRPDIVPIPGAKRRATMTDSVASADITLSADDMTLLDGIGKPAGLRYPEQMLAAVNI
jgi:aryl-alcohol dehydrogenase-like predicted oxidoreductase